MIQRTSDGLFASLNRFAETALDAVKNRVELIAVEIREEKARFLAVFLWASIALFMGMMSVIVLTATILLLCSAEARPWVAALLTVLYLGGAVWAVVMVRKRLTNPPLPFSETLNQLHKDRNCLSNAK